MEVFDRTAIEAEFGTKLRGIYIATEGLLAVTCGLDGLHLTEDCMHFELEDVGGGLVSPVITDSNHTTQIMLRYWMNDLLRMDADARPCGSPLRVLHEIVGRMNDAFHLRIDDGHLIERTPDLLRNAIVDSDRAIIDFRLVQTGANRGELKLDTGASRDAGTKAVEQLIQLFARHCCTPRIALEFLDLASVQQGKLRRVKNRTTIVWDIKLT